VVEDAEYDPLDLTMDWRRRIPAADHTALISTVPLYSERRRSWNQGIESRTWSFASHRKTEAGCVGIPGLAARVITVLRPLMTRVKQAIARSTSSSNGTCHRVPGRIDRASRCRLRAGVPRLPGHPPFCTVPRGLECGPSPGFCISPGADGRHQLYRRWDSPGSYDSVYTV